MQLLDQCDMWQPDHYKIRSILENTVPDKINCSTLKNWIREWERLREFKNGRKYRVYHIEMFLSNSVWQIEICKSNFVWRWFYNQFLWNSYCVPSIGPDVNNPQFHLIFAQFLLVLVWFFSWFWASVSHTHYCLHYSHIFFYFCCYSTSFCCMRSELLTYFQKPCKNQT